MCLPSLLSLLKWKPADVKSMQLKDDITIPDQSSPSLTFSFSPVQCCDCLFSKSVTIKTQGPGELLEPTYTTVSVCCGHELISWYDLHGKYNSVKGKHDYCSAMLFNLSHSCQIATRAVSPFLMMSLQARYRVIETMGHYQYLPSSWEVDKAACDCARLTTNK